MGDNAIVSFASWLESFNAAQANGRSLDTDLLNEGRRLAAARQPVMQALMRGNPWRALDQSLRWHEWVGLPKDIQALVEEPFSEVGDLEVIFDSPTLVQEGGFLQSLSRCDARHEFPCVCLWVSEPDDFKSCRSRCRALYWEGTWRFGKARP